MRVIAGSRRSLPLKSVPGLSSRPTQDRIKETLFNMLSPYLGGCIFADLFSGTGGIGIEALSRGASRCFFVEKDRKTAAVLKENLVFTRFTEESTILQTDIFSAIGQLEQRLGQGADIIFMDPPYHERFEEPVLKRLSGSVLVNEDTLIIAEADIRTDFFFAETLGFSLIKNKLYKTNKHVWLKKEVV